MSTDILVTGVLGRMGSTVCSLVQAGPNLNLAAVVEKPGNEALLGAFNCPKGSSLEDVWQKAPKSVAIDFSAPAVSLQNARIAASLGTAIVIGTTGFSDDERAELESLAEKTPVFWSPNMSVGVNALLAVLPKLAKALGSSYDVEIMEIHHNKKKDSPSGTALRLAECIADAKSWNLSDTACYHREGIIGERPQKEIGLQTLRGGDVVGVHTVYFLGPGERIEVNHQAHSRETFAEGAIRAAVWLAEKKGGKLYSMTDLLDF